MRFNEINDFNLVNEYISEMVGIVQEYNTQIIMEANAVLTNDQLQKFFSLIAKAQLAKKQGLDYTKVLDSKNGEGDSKIKKAILSKLQKALNAASEIKDFDPKEYAKELKEKSEKLIKKYGNKEGVSELVKQLYSYTKNNKKKIAITLAIIAAGVAVGAVAGPWAAKLTSFILKVGVSYLQNNGKVDWATLIKGAALGASAGALTHGVDAISHLLHHTDGVDTGHSGLEPSHKYPNPVANYLSDYNSHPELLDKAVQANIANGESLPNAWRHAVKDLYKIDPQKGWNHDLGASRDIEKMRFNQFKDHFKMNAQG